MRIFEIITESTNPYDQSSPTEKWQIQQDEKAARLPDYQKNLLAYERLFFAKVTKTILNIVPDAIEIWLHGSRAIGEHKRTSDWDFVAFLPEMTVERHIELHARGKGGLSDIDKISGRRVDIQADHIMDNSDFCRIVREEGIVIWKR